MNWMNPYPYARPSRNLQAANVWNNRLATEFEDAEAEMDVVETALSLETFRAEVLRSIIAELKEEDPWSGNFRSGVR
jgi:hypothetical protein